MTQQNITGQLVTAINNANQVVNFCASGTVEYSPTTQKGISIEGLGEISLPLRPKDVREIIAFADAAPYGKGTKTIIDQSVRNSLEIKASKLTVSGELDQAVQTAARAAAKAIGLDDGRVQAKLYKLLIYQKGGFFLPHQDSEKRKNMVASMVVMLPSKFGGGELIVQHDGKTKRFTFDGAASAEQCEFAAFYADCMHEVGRVSKGVRVCLSYNLCLKPQRKQKVGEPNAVLVSAITEWTQTRPADPMVFALEHQYTAAGLKPDLLKGNDQAAAEQLIAAADQADCHIHFGQVSRHLLQYADNGSYGRRQWAEWSNVQLEDLELGESYEDEVLIDGWKTAKGKRVQLAPMNLDSSMLISTTPLSEWKPTSFDYEGFTGNAGQTLDRWFHKSAIVIWSKTDHFDVLVKMGHRNSIEMFLEMHERGSKLKNKASIQRSRQESLAFAEAIIRAWPSRFPIWHQPLLAKNAPSCFKQFADSLPDYENVELIEGFLHAMATRDWLSPLDRLLRESFKRFGADVVLPLLQRFLQTMPPANEYGHRRASGLPIRDADWLLKIAASRNQSGLQADQFSQLFDLMLQRLGADVAEENSRLSSHRNKDAISLTFTTLMKAAITADNDVALGRCLQLRDQAGELFDKREFDVKFCKELVNWSDKRFGSRLASLSHWLQETRSFLESETANEPEPPSDFARPDAVDCACPQCAQLQAFLANPELETAEIKALKRQLIHVQDQIRHDKLDTTTQMDRSTRPFTLRLKKTEGSYARVAKRFGEDLKRLASLPNS